MRRRDAHQPLPAGTSISALTSGLPRSMPSVPPKPRTSIVASAAVVEMLLDEESQHLAGLSDFIGKPISLRAEPFPSPEQYDIVLL